MDANMAGVYRITCVANGKVYIGSSVNVRNRLNFHRHRLSHNTHINIHLQRAWNKYGSDKFVFEIIEEVESSCLLEHEQSAIDFHDSAKTGFNLRQRAHNNMGLKHSHATRSQIGASQIGRQVSAETRIKIGNAHRGKIRSVEERAKQSASRRGIKFGPEWIAKLSAAQVARYAIQHAARVERHRLDVIRRFSGAVPNVLN